jgi:tetratricopeptide (TPR) repeat protein
MMFQAVITDNRFYIDAFDQLAESFHLQGKTEEAFDVLQKAAKLSPNSVPRQRALGNTALKLGNIPVAEKAFRKCIEIGEFSVRKTVDAISAWPACAARRTTPRKPSACSTPPSISSAATGHAARQDHRRTGVPRERRLPSRAQVRRRTGSHAGR